MLKELWIDCILGWAVGSHGTEEGQNRLITARNRAVVVSINYRKAPEFRFPCAIDDSFDGLLWVGFLASPHSDRADDSF